MLPARGTLDEVPSIWKKEKKSFITIIEDQFFNMNLWEKLDEKKPAMTAILQKYRQIAEKHRDLGV